jgi:hypothetical protein
MRRGEETAPPRDRPPEGAANTTVGRTRNQPGEDSTELVRRPLHGRPGPTDPPKLDYPELDNNFDLLNRWQAFCYALHRTAHLAWARLDYPEDVAGRLRLLLRAAKHGTVPKDEWLQAAMAFMPGKPDWRAP